MINVRIIALGKLKEKYLSDAVREYEKRLSPFCRFEVTELEPERLPDEPSEAQITSALEAEAVRVLARVPQGCFTAALCVEGKQISSEALAEKIADLAAGGTGTLVFIIGSSFGLSERVKSAASLRLSMSEMTFPHQLARVMLAEQIYRAFTIINHRKYHK